MILYPGEYVHALELLDFGFELFVLGLGAEMAVLHGGIDTRVRRYGLWLGPTSLLGWRWLIRPRGFFKLRNLGLALILRRRGCLACALLGLALIVGFSACPRLRTLGCDRVGTTGMQSFVLETAALAAPTLLRPLRAFVGGLRRGGVGVWWHRVGCER